MATLKERVDRHDREIAAIRKLLLTGMKMLVKMEKEHVAFRKEMREEMRELRASQRETDRQLQAFIRSLRQGSNGHSGGGLDIQ